MSKREKGGVEEREEKTDGKRVGAGGKGKKEVGKRCALIYIGTVHYSVITLPLLVRCSLVAVLGRKAQSVTVKRSPPRGGRGDLPTGGRRKVL